MAGQPPADIPPELVAEIDLAARRLPLVERGVELTGASLGPLRRAVGDAREMAEASPRRKVKERIERLAQDVAFLRRQLEKVAAQLSARAEAVDRGQGGQGGRA